MFNNIDKIENKFKEKQYHKVNFNEGFFFINYDTDITISFNEITQTVEVYFYDDYIPAQINNEILGLIIFAIKKLGW